MASRGSASRPPAPEDQLEVYLHIGHETERCPVGELALRGLFLRTSQAYPPQQLVHLSILLPSGEELSVHGMVEDVIEPTEATAIGTSPGVSVRFYGLGRVARQRWESFLHEAGVTSAAPEALPDGAEGAPSASAAPSWAREPSLLLRARGGDGPTRAPSPLEKPRMRVPDALVGHIVYRLVLPTTEAVVRFGRTALEAGGLFVAPSALRPTGTPAIVSVVHPETRAEYHLPGEICPDPARRSSGVSVAFTSITPRTMTDFMRFADPELATSGPPARESAAPYLELSVSELSREVALAELLELLDENTEEIEIHDLDSLLVTPAKPQCS